MYYSINNKFKIGDKLVLISGGPEMTVGGYDTYNYGESEKMVICDWFDLKGDPKNKTFHEDQLTKPED